MSNNKHFSKMHIWLRIIALRLLRMYAAALVHYKPTPDNNKIYNIHIF